MAPAGLPSTVMPPWAMGINPSSAFIMVVFPAPLVPTMAVTEPCGIRKVPCCQMMCPPRETPASSNSIQNDALSCMARSLDKSTIVFSQTVLTIILNKKHAWTMKSLVMNPPGSYPLLEKRVRRCRGITRHRRIGGGRMTVALFTGVRLPCVVRRCGVGIGVGIVVRRLLAIRFRGRDVRI